MSKRILFVSHNASRSGAPILLLRLMRWLKANTDFEIDIALLRGGALEAEFREIAGGPKFENPLRLIHASGVSGARLGAPLGMRGLGRLFSRLATRVIAGRALRNGADRYDMIYANTAAAGYVLTLLKRFGCPIVTHIHEMEYALSQMPESWRLVRENSDRYIAVSRAVRDNLVANRGIAAGDMDIVYGFVDAADFNIDRAAARSRFRTELGLGPDTFLVGGSGTIEWRKGTDLFVQVAIAAIATEKTLGRNVAFVWVGGDAENKLGRELVKRVSKLELESRILFVGEKPDPAEYFAALDIFALTSREDPFPLVCLEAGAQGVPTVCFEGCGGIPELLEGGGGSIIPGLDAGAMAVEIGRYAADPALLAREGDAISRKVMEHHTVDVVAPRIVAIMRRAARQ